MSETKACVNLDGTENKSEINITHYCGNCDDEIWEWAGAENVTYSKSQVDALLLAHTEAIVKAVEDRYWSIPHEAAENPKMIRLYEVLSAIRKAGGE